MNLVCFTFVRLLKCVWGLHCTCVFQAYLTRYGYLTDLTDPLDPRNLDELIQALKYVRSLPFQSKTTHMANRSVFIHQPTVYIRVCWLLGVGSDLWTSPNEFCRSLFCLQVFPASERSAAQRRTGRSHSGGHEKASLWPERPLQQQASQIQSDRWVHRMPPRAPCSSHVHTSRMVPLSSSKYLWTLRSSYHCFILYCMFRKPKQNQHGCLQVQTTQTLSIDFSYKGVSSVI